MISTNQIVASVIDLGLLIGVLQKSGSGFTVNTAWFSDTVSNLESTACRLDELVAVFYEILGTQASEPPALVKDPNNWLMVQNPWADGKSPFYIVVPQKDASSGTIGIGAILPSSDNGVDYEVYVYIPLFSFSPSGATFLLNQADSAIQLGMMLTKSTGSFISDAVTFTGLKLDACIYLSDTTPTLTLDFLGLTGTNEPSHYSSISSLNSDVITWLANVLIQASGWLNKPLTPTSLTVGGLLNAAGLVTASKDTPPQYSSSLAVLNALPSAEQIAINFSQYLLVTALNDSTNKQLVALPGGGIYLIATDNFANYGLKVQINMPLNDGTGSQSSLPAATFCLGSYLAGEGDCANWMTRTLPTGCEAPDDGLILWLMTAKNNVFSFAPGFSFSSIGLDLAGNAGNALIDLNGYTLQKAQLRVTLDAVNLDSPDSWTFGFAAKLFQLGIPLVPAVAGNVGDGSNPVAQSLLQGNDSKPDEATNPDSQSAQGDNSPVNPAFSIATAWYQNGSFNVELYDSNDKPTDQVILPMNRKLGPLECDKLGIGWINASDMLSLLFDGDVKTGPLQISLQGLTVDIPTATPTVLSNYHLDLDGIGITFKAGEINIDAALIKIPASTTKTITEYDGTATIEAGIFSVAALGSYGYLEASKDQNGGASLFIFGSILSPIGGSPMFFVTGVAAGFGYNRAILLPAADSVSSFPLVAALSNPALLGASKTKSGGWTFPDPAKVLSSMDSVVPVQRGEYWLAAGVRFTSYDFIHSTALLSVEFGRELEIALLGDSWISMPPPVNPEALSPPDIAYAYAELGIEIQVIPSQGVVSVSAILSNNSYVLDKNCHLTGGFAFCAWFGSSPHAGEFVLTLGGYHPLFTPPSYYPQVPRLGFSWSVSDTVSISGTSYFALTSSSIMTGGGLQFLFHLGGLKAWFNAQMDALIVWSPFQYQLSIAVTVGVSYRIHIWFVDTTLKVEIGAKLSLWGPRMGGLVHINWVIISFSISFGSSKGSIANKPIPWVDNNAQGFAQTLLPQPTNTGGILTITALSGMNTTYTDSNGKLIWIVNPSDFSFATLTAIPLTEMIVTPVASETAHTHWLATDVCPDGNNYFVSIRPMAATLASSRLNVTLTNNDTGQIYDLGADFDLSLSIVGTQAAKWGQPLAAGANPEMNATLGGRLFGFQCIKPKLPTLATPLSIDISTAFTPWVIDQQSRYLQLSPSATAQGSIPVVNDNAWTEIAQSLQSPEVTAARSSVYDILVQQFGFDPVTNDDVSVFALNPAAWLNGEPLILSSYQSN